MTRARRRTQPAHAPVARPGPSSARASPRSAAILSLFAAVFLVLGTTAYRQTSATWDEPIHLTAGLAATRLDFRVEPAHPPFLRMWAALPAIVDGTTSVDTGVIDARPPDSWLQEAYLFAHRLLYVEHDADRLLYRGRFMILLLGVALGAVLFHWAREWLGLWPAVAVLVLCALEPNLLSHASLVTTDFGLAVFAAGAVYFAWRLQRDGGWPTVAGLAGCTALAIVSKFSGLLLVPLVASLLAAAVAFSRLSIRRAVIAGSVTAGVTCAVIWASYGFRYLPSGSETWRFAVQATSMGQDTSLIAAVASWADAWRLLPNAFTYGLLYAHTSVLQLPGYLAGNVSQAGWWYYFPAAIALKTPLVLLLLCATGLIACARRYRELGPFDILFVLAPIALFLGVAMTSGVNLGIRHVLPIYPFMLLLAAIGAREVLRRHATGAAVLTVAALVLVVEVASAYPHTLTFFNLAAGGPSRGHRYLIDSNLDWGQGLKALKTWMTRHDVAHVNLAYFGQADPAYYGIGVTHLPGAPTFALDAIARPRVPGYVAISATTLAGVYSAPEWRLFYRPFRDLDPVAVVGNSIHVYWIDDWPSVDTEGTDDAMAHGRLADALTFGLQWPEQALDHYRTYIESRPDDTDALVNYGIALVATQREEEALAVFRRAVASNGQHGRAQQTLARALVGIGDLQGARQHAEQATLVSPADADAHYLLGRVHAAQGQFVAARRDFERATQIRPHHQEAQRDLARVRQEIAMAAGGRQQSAENP